MMSHRGIARALQSPARHPDRCDIRSFSRHFAACKSEIGQLHLGPQPPHMASIPELTGCENIYINDPLGIKEG